MLFGVVRRLTHSSVAQNRRQGKKDGTRWGGVGWSMKDGVLGTFGRDFSPQSYHQLGGGFSLKLRLDQSFLLSISE